MENKKTKFIAFIAGHGHRKVLNKQILVNYLSKNIQGYVMIDIPSSEWKGFGFVYMRTSKDLKIFLKQSQLTINGC